MELVRIELLSENLTYVIDYFLFENLTSFPSNLSRQEFLLDLPSIGCDKIDFLGSSKFSLYLPDILKLQIKKPKIGKDDSENDELMDIIYDNKNQKIRVDNFKDKYFEIAELAKKNFFYFKNNEQCTPFHKQTSYSKNLQTAIEFVTDIYKLGKTNFYHIGQQVMESNAIADVFEFSTSEPKNKNVITLYATKVRKCCELC